MRWGTNENCVTRATLGNHWDGGPMRTVYTGLRWGTNDMGDLRELCYQGYIGGPMTWGTNESGGPMIWGTNGMGGGWVLIGGPMRWGTNEMGDHWDGGPMRWGTNDVHPQLPWVLYRKTIVCHSRITIASMYYRQDLQCKCKCTSKVSHNMLNTLKHGYTCGFQRQPLFKC